MITGLDLPRREVQNILQSDELQSLLKDRRYQDLIGGIIFMNQAGQRNASRHPGNKLHCLTVLELTLTGQYLDSLFLHLRENPALCQRFL